MKADDMTVEQLCGAESRRDRTGIAVVSGKGHKDVLDHRPTCCPPGEYL
jgi:hypothetical protein